MTKKLSKQSTTKVAICSILFLSYAHADVANRIGGGSVAERDQFPFFAQLNIPTTNPRVSRVCGATLVHPQWVLTAAHCFDTVPIEKVEAMQNANMVFMGSVKLADVSAYKNSLSRIVIHPSYSVTGAPGHMQVRNDIALCRLRYNYRLDKDLQTVALPPHVITNLHRCETGILIGTGVVSWGYPRRSKYVLYAEVNVRDEPFYSDKYGSSTNFYSKSYLMEGHPLQGDSGGPFVCYPIADKKIAVQHGIISMSSNTSDGNFILGFYEDVAKHINWIRSIIPDLEGFTEGYRTIGLKVIKPYQQFKSFGIRINSSYFILILSSIILCN